MVLLNSERIKLGIAAPDFSLTAVDGKKYKLADFSAKKVLVVMFICNHCPYVQAIEDRILKLGQDYKNSDVQLIGICSNDPTDYPDDSPQSLLKRWKEKHYSFPYLIDETQDVAKLYGAVCTPDIFVFDQKRTLAYHGQLDDSWKDPKIVTREDLRNAIEKIRASQPVSAEQVPSMGCSIKWKKST